MRWMPTDPVCAECRFDWTLDMAAAVAGVRDCPAAVGEALATVGDPTSRRGDRWSASMYVWHLVDVLRIGTERLLTLEFDPGRGVPCWDENALSVVRRYELLSPAVGLRVLGQASTEWTDTAAGCDPGAVTDHPEFGPISALDIARRNSHEVVHHTMDIARS